METFAATTNIQSYKTEYPINGTGINSKSLISLDSAASADELLCHPTLCREMLNAHKTIKRAEIQIQQVCLHTIKNEDYQK